MKKLVFFLILLGSGTSIGQASAESGSGVPACRFVPGVSVPAIIPANLPSSLKSPPATLPSASKTPIDPGTTSRQLAVYQGVWNAVNDHYVYPDFRKKDWKAIGAKYEALTKQGLSDEDFYQAMNLMVQELGDEHSYFQSPAKIQEEKAALASQFNFVGIGTMLVQTPEEDGGAFIMSVFPGGPAAKAGLRSHDLIRKVEGGPVREKDGRSRTLGLEGSQVKLTIQRPGAAAHDVTLTRGRVTGALPVDYCLVPGTRIGYIFIPTLLDKSMPAQVRAALQKLTAAGPMQGLILDNRMNGGGLGSVTEQILGFFANGPQGNYVSRAGPKPLAVKAENIGGSQTVPMVVLISPNTVSYAEIMSGVLRLAGRAKLVGEKTQGNVEQLKSYNFPDGSRAWIASASFAPKGQAGGVWEDAGVQPDVVVPTRWDQFTEANDPAMAKAIELLKK